MFSLPPCLVGLSISLEGGGAKTWGVATKLGVVSNTAGLWVPLTTQELKNNLLSVFRPKNVPFFFKFYDFPPSRSHSAPVPLTCQFSQAQTSSDLHKPAVTLTSPGLCSISAASARTGPATRLCLSGLTFTPSFYCPLYKQVQRVCVSVCECACVCFTHCEGFIKWRLARPRGPAAPRWAAQPGRIKGGPK